MKIVKNKNDTMQKVEYMPLDKPLLVYNMSEEEKNALKIELCENGNSQVKAYFKYMKCDPEDVGDIVFNIAYGSKAILTDDTKK